MVRTWLGEIRSCSCLAILPDSAWVLLNKIYQPFFTSLYMLALSFPQVTPLLPLLHPCETQIINGLLELATEYDKLQRFMARHRDHERHRGSAGQGRRVLEMKVSTFRKL